MVTTRIRNQKICISILFGFMEFATKTMDTALFSAIVLTKLWTQAPVVKARRLVTSRGLIWDIAALREYNPNSKVHGAHMGPSGADRTQVAPCWPHELCYLGRFQRKVIITYFNAIFPVIECVISQYSNRLRFGVKGQHDWEINLYWNFKGAVQARFAGCFIRTG